MLNLENLRPWEKVIMTVRRHWIVYIILWLVFISWILASILSYALFPVDTVVHMINIVFWMFFAIVLYIKWLDHELDMYAVTNNRIIWIDQVAFLNRTVTECNLWQVQEVNSRTKGLFANMLNYWSLTILTAWNATNMVMDFSPDSMQVARKILNIVDDYRDKKWQTEIASDTLETEIK
jgi:hypothetical protein